MCIVCMVIMITIIIIIIINISIMVIMIRIEGSGIYWVHRTRQCGEGRGGREERE